MLSQSFSTNRQLITALLLTALLLVLATALAMAADVTAADLGPIVTAHVRAKILAYKGKSQLGGDESLSIKVLSIPGAPYHFADSKSINLTCESASWNNSWSDRGLVRVKMTDATGRSRDVGIPVQVTVQQPIWVVRNTVSANSPLSMNDLKLEMRDVSQNYAYVAGTEMDLGAYTARVNLLPGEWLDTRKVTIPPDVRYNDQVHIVMIGPNGMELNVPGVALSDGRIGQTIRVRQSQFQRRDYQGKIIEKNQVQVEL